jgi:cell wall-associated NlpC family hydrolase
VVKITPLIMSYFIINTAVANVYKEASHNSAVVTQALMGESCQILEQKDDWFRIKQCDGNEGWMYYFYGVVSKQKYGPTLTLKDMHGTVITIDKDKMISPIVFGTQLVAEEQQDRYKVTLPDGRIGYAYSNFGDNSKLTTRKEIISLAERFMGTPYIWGGKTPYGIDCSGLIQTVFKANGIDLPRDAYQQEEHLRKYEIAEDKIEPGDLLFFSENDKVTHVAISIGGLNFINARGYVQVESIDEKSPQFNRNLRDLFLHSVSIKELING